MYLNFYGLKEEPFHVTPDPNYFFASTTHREALASIVYGVNKRKGFLSLIGEVGTGKTTIIRAFMQSIENAKIKSVLVSNPNVSFEDLLRNILNDPLNQDPAHILLINLQQQLINYHSQGYNFVVIIDEAQNMPIATLEQLRMLSNVETDTTKLVQLVLVGQPELGQKLKQHQLRQLNQRIAVKTTTRNLSQLESLSYMRHRLATAGQILEKIFKPKAVEEIIKYADGNPRIINILCDNILIAGYGCQQKPISLSLVEEVISDFYGSKKRPKSAKKVLLPLSAAAVLTALMAGAYQAELLPTAATLEKTLSGMTSTLSTVLSGNDAENDSDRNQTDLARYQPELSTEPAASVSSAKSAVAPDQTRKSSATAAAASSRESKAAAVESKVATVVSSIERKSHPTRDAVAINAEGVRQPEKRNDNERRDNHEDAIKTSLPLARTDNPISRDASDDKKPRVADAPAVTGETVSLMQIEEPESESESESESETGSRESNPVTKIAEPAVDTSQETLISDQKASNDQRAITTDDKIQRPSVPIPAAPPDTKTRTTAVENSDSDSSEMVNEVSLQLANTSTANFKRIESGSAESKIFPITKIVQRGDEVFDLCEQIYGFCNGQILALVQSNNTHIRNLNVIYPGLKIVFPKLEKIKRIDGK